METSSYKIIDREIVMLATKNFIKNGGKIKILPPEKAISKATIVRNDLVAYEGIHDFIL